MFQNQISISNEIQALFKKKTKMNNQKIYVYQHYRSHGCCLYLHMVINIVAYPLVYSELSDKAELISYKNKYNKKFLSIRYNNALTVSTVKLCKQRLNWKKKSLSFLRAFVHTSQNYLFIYSSKCKFAI